VRSKRSQLAAELDPGRPLALDEPRGRGWSDALRLIVILALPAGGTRGRLRRIGGWQPLLVRGRESVNQPGSTP